MWRNSGSFSSTLFSRTRPDSLLSALVSPYRGHPRGGGGGRILAVLFAPSSSSHLHSSSSGIPSPFDSLKPGLTKPLQSRPFILSSCSSSAATALSPSSSISKAARDAADALQHYSRCYWELSKARLRSHHSNAFSLSILQYENWNGVFRTIRFCLFWDSRVLG